jgi:hypothetical protein
MPIIKAAYPPNIDKISARFNIKGRKNLIFTYGDTIFYPAGRFIPEHLIVHESIHIKQQEPIGAEAWWDRYLKDDKFRLSQEVEAYHAQYLYVCQYQRRSKGIILAQTARDLSSEIYGDLCTYMDAQKYIKRGNDGHNN